MLRLVSKESPPNYGTFLPKSYEEKLNAINNSPHDLCAFDVKEIVKDLYHVNFQDLFHGIGCHFTIEKRRQFDPTEEWNEDFSPMKPTISGDFTVIDLTKLNKKVFDDEYLCNMLLFQFQLNMLEQLLLFSEEVDAGQLILIFNEKNQHYYDVFEPFVTSKEEVISRNGEGLEITIPCTLAVYDQLIDLIEEVEHGLQQTLWREQKYNPTYRNYLKSRALV